MGNHQWQKSDGAWSHGKLYLPAFPGKAGYNGVKETGYNFKGGEE